MARGNKVTKAATPGKVQIIRLDPDVHRRLKIAAAEQGQNLKGMVSRIVAEWLARHERRRAA